MTGDDHFQISGSFSKFYGDVNSSSSITEAKCGNDMFILGSAAQLLSTSGVAEGLFGDCYLITPGHVITCGDDTINASAVSSSMYLVGDTKSSSDLITYGNDLIVGGSAIDTIFGDSVENSSSMINGGNDRLFGNGGADNIFGGGGDDWIDGGTGNDYMFGSFGDDTYIVDSALDQVWDEQSFDGGYDTVRASVSYIMSFYIEKLALTGAANINATGNQLDNVMIGNSGNNNLNGLGGADMMSGGGGNDTYFVDNIRDVVAENAGGGTVDTVVTALNYTLPDEVENLRLQGTATTGAGNALSNSLFGNALANTLNGLDGGDSLYGGGGSDQLYGGTGADRFFFDTALGSTNIDKIWDFSAVDDTLLLSRAIFTAAGPAGRLATTAYKEIGYTGAAAIDASDRIIHNRATGDIFYDADGSAAGAAVLFARVGANIVMTNADFSLY